MIKEVCIRRSDTPASCKVWKEDPVYPNLLNWSIRFAEGRAEKLLSAAPCQKRTAKKCSGADKKSSTFQKWSPRCVFRKISLSPGVSTIGEESNAVGLVTNGITDKQRKSMTSVVWFNPLRLPISKISCPTGCSGSQTSHPGTMRML